MLAALLLLSITAQARCATCHPREVATFEQSAMGRSISTDAPQPDGRVQHSKSHSAVIIKHTGKQMTQRLEADGMRVEYPIAYAVGAGKAGFSYLVQISDYLFQSPVSYYSQERAWDVTPGYEPEPVLDFTHPISEGCIFCHAASARAAAGTDNRFPDPLRAISCERCHGSAEAHLKSPVPGSIVNPAKLSASARDSVCEQCHLEGAARVLNPGKRWTDFQPGGAAESVFVTYVLHADRSEGVKAVSHSEQLALSRCARESNGRLWCGSCHDPHSASTNRAAEVRTVCMGCHAAVFADAKHKPADECVSCHMPRLRPNNIAHTAITDHWIALPSQHPKPTAPNGALTAWREPDKDLIARDFGLALFQTASGDQKADHVVRSYEVLKSLPLIQRGDPDVLAALGSVLLSQNQKEVAQKLYSDAVAARPQSARFAYCLGVVDAARGDTLDAVAQLRRSIQIDPSDPEPYRKLADVYRTSGNPGEARAALREYLEFMPQNLLFRRLIEQQH